MDFRQVNKLEPKMVEAKGRRCARFGKFCPCCCLQGGNPSQERKAVNRARRRLDKALVRAAVFEF